MLAFFSNWLRPTLPRPFGLSTISDEELNFCVRYGNRCILFSVITILFLWIYILRITALNFISSFSHISIVCSFNFHSFNLHYSYPNPNIFHLLFKLRPSSLDIVSFLSHVLYTLLRHLLICLKLLVLNVKIYLLFLTVSCTIKTAYHLFSKIYLVLHIFENIFLLG